MMLFVMHALAANTAAASDLPDGVYKIFIAGGDGGDAAYGMKGWELAGHKVFQTDTRDWHSVYASFHPPAPERSNNHLHLVKEGQFHKIIVAGGDGGSAAYGMEGWELAGQSVYTRDERDGSSVFAMFIAPGGNEANNLFQVQQVDHLYKIIIAAGDAGSAEFGMGGWELAGQEWYDRDKRDAYSSFAMFHSPSPGRNNNLFFLQPIPQSELAISSYLPSGAVLAALSSSILIGIVIGSGLLWLWRMRKARDASPYTTLIGDGEK